MFEKIFYFDTSKMNWKGWLFLLITVGLLVSAFATVMIKSQGAAPKTQQRLLYGMLGAGAVFFVGGRLLLDKLGISLHREDPDPADDLD